MTDSVTSLYQRNVQAGLIQADAAQQQALIYLDHITHALQAQTSKRFMGMPFIKRKSVKGLYLWGAVGRGKTLLTELFLQALGEVPYQRWHFHRFMNYVHQQLALLPNTADTLAVLAKSLSKNCQVLVLDEFFVSDIGDAMILYRLLEQLMRYGVSLVTTSNVQPDDLYLHGLQRTSFLPCIVLLKQECDVLELLSTQDYRLRMLSHAETYITPNDTASIQVLSQQYCMLSGAVPITDEIDINNRTIPVLAFSTGVAWFAFTALCEGPRSTADYIEIARNFHTVLISDVPRLGKHNEDAVLRFVYLIDELYDRHVNVLLSAEVDALALYQGQRLQREFSRTCSRLIEMQSKDYLALAHRP
jgi:cell division protein ZapE